MLIDYKLDCTYEQGTFASYYNSIPYHHPLKVIFTHAKEILSRWWEANKRILPAWMNLNAAKSPQKHHTAFDAGFLSLIMK